MNDIKYVQKPWGAETIWAHTDSYVGKILHVHSGESLSVQYHEFKDETMYVIAGKGIIKFFTQQDDKTVLDGVHFVNPGDAVHIPPKRIHSVEAFEDMDIVEVSTNHLDDLVRLKDRYGR
jgi:mannose-6-phosphate isomerase-like protein (cupin superfamily)